MIKEFEFYHGLVFARILHATQQRISITSFPTPDNGSYIINDKIGIYIKYRTSRLSPWTFSFQQRHQDEILDMKNKVGEVYLLLVCNDDGVVVLSFDELKQILNEKHESVEWIRVSRHKREMYAVRGSDGKLEFKVARDDFPKKIFSEIKTSELPSIEPPIVIKRVFSWSDS